MMAHPPAFPIEAWNDERAHPFVWTKTADEILKRANPQMTSKTDH
jgi:hypothetical protein